MRALIITLALFAAAAASAAHAHERQKYVPPVAAFIYGPAYQTSRAPGSNTPTGWAERCKPSPYRAPGCGR